MTRFEFAAWTDQGPVRSRNEDRWLAEPAAGLFAVIDGMGGHAGGEQAAEIARDALREAPTPGEGLMLANRRIWEAVQADPALAGMGCVATAARFGPDGLRVTHVGDTAAWLVTEAGAEVLTARHTRAAALQASHVLGDEEAAALGVSNQLLRDVGGQLREDTAWFDVSEPVPFSAGDLLFLGSDGVHGPLSHGALLSRLREGRATHEPLDRLARALVDLALAQGGRDNATAVVVRILPADAVTRPVRIVDGTPPKISGPAPAPPRASPPPVSAPPPGGSTARSLALLMIGALAGVALAAWVVSRSAPPPAADPPSAPPPAVIAPGTVAPGAAPGAPPADPGAAPGAPPADPGTPAAPVSPPPAQPADAPPTEAPTPSAP